MQRYNLHCSTLLNDGDTALHEEYKRVDSGLAKDIIEEYIQRASDKSYVVSCSFTITKIETKA